MSRQGRVPLFSADSEAHARGARLLAIVRVESACRARGIHMRGIGGAGPPFSGSVGAAPPRGGTFMAMTGRCLCGQVRYQLEGELPPLVNCHCQFCRRAHGAAFVTVAWVPRSALRFTAGESSVSRYVVGGGYRCFCAKCGTRLFNGLISEEGYITLIVSTLDDDGHPGPVLHINVESKAEWHCITDELPRRQSMSGEVIAHLRAVQKERLRGADRQSTR